MITENNPFIYGKIVIGEKFVNRTDEIKRLQTNFISGINSIIISRRRLGKSSLVKQTGEKLNSKKFRFIYIDLFTISSEEEFYNKLIEKVISKGFNKLDELFTVTKEFFTKIVPKLSFKIDPLTDLSVSFPLSKKPEEKEEILNLPEKIAIRKNIKFVICIDEFQNISSYENSDTFEKLLRAVWQTHNNVSYCLLGSKKHLMSEIFNKEVRPFYKFGDILYLEKIEDKHWEKFITENFIGTGKIISCELAREIISIAKCDPYYVQMLSYFVWNRVGKEATVSDIQNSTEMVLNSNRIFYQSLIEKLSTKQINLIMAVANCESEFSSSETMKKYNLGTSATVTKNKILLDNADLIDFSKSPAAFYDPFFEIWFKKTFLD